ncbi:MAG: hypothetical protein WBD62_17040 [Anaerolineales bacterium]|jgi:hypothetical protein|nr:hypothetical protein [Anaerolineales bacterium]
MNAGAGLVMQIVMSWNSPLEAGAMTEYGVMLIPLLDTGNDFPTGKMN